MINSDITYTADGEVVIHADCDDENTLLLDLLRALAAIEGTSTTALDSLYESVEPEALASLLRHANEQDSLIGVEFAYSGFVIAITERGYIRIHEGPPKIAQLGAECD